MPESAPAEAQAEATKEAPSPMLFGAFLHQHRSGGLHNELTDELAEVVAAVINVQARGDITIKLAIEPAEGDDRQVIIRDEVKSKIPRPKTLASRFFSNTTGVLSRRDPRQQEIEGLREVPSE